MPNGFRPTINPISPFQTVANVRTSDYVGVNAGKQGRFQARCDRRWGNWSMLEVPTPILWLGYDWEPSLNEPGEFISPVVVELWP